MSKIKQEATPLQIVNDIDRLVHEPARLLILGCLSVVECADFLFLMNQSNLTRGNLSSHLSKLEEAGYVSVEKTFVDKVPRTLISLTQNGRNAFEKYLSVMNSVVSHFS